MSRNLFVDSLFPPCVDEKKYAAPKTTTPASRGASSGQSSQDLQGFDGAESIIDSTCDATSNGHSGASKGSEGAGATAHTPEHPSVPSSTARRTNSQPPNNPRVTRGARLTAKSSPGDGSSTWEAEKSPTIVTSNALDAEGSDGEVDEGLDSGGVATRSRSRLGGNAEGSLEEEEGNDDAAGMNGGGGGREDSEESVEETADVGGCNDSDQETLSA